MRFIGEPGRFSSDPEMKIYAEGILSKITFVFDIKGGAVNFYALKEDYDPVGSYEYFQPVRQESSLPDDPKQVLETVQKEYNLIHRCLTDDLHLETRLIDNPLGNAHAET